MDRRPRSQAQSIAAASVTRTESAKAASAVRRVSPRKMASRTGPVLASPASPRSDSAPHALRLAPARWQSQAATQVQEWRARGNGGENSKKSLIETLIPLRRAEMRGADHEGRERPAEAIMNPLRRLQAMVRAKEIEIALIVPLMHDPEAIEQRNVVRLRHRAHVVQVGRHRNHRLGARTILRIDQDHVG